MRLSGRLFRPRGATAALFFLLSFAGIAVGTRARTSQPERVGYVVLTVAYPGGSATDVDRDVLLPIEQAIRADTASHRIARVASTARDGEARFTVSAIVANLDPVATVVSQAVSRVRPQLPASIETRISHVGPATSHAFHSTDPAVLATSLVQAATVGLFLSFFTSRRWRSATVDNWLEKAAERFHDALAWMLAHRRTITMVAAVAGVALTLQAARAVGLRRDGRITFDNGRITFDVRGADSQTLNGVANRIADEMRAVRGVTRVVTASDSTSENGGPIQIDRVDQRRVVRVHALVHGRPSSDIRSDISAKVATTPLPPGYEASEHTESNPANISLRAVLTALGTALVATLALLAIQFRSFVQPLVVACSLLVSIGGVAAVLMLSRHSPTFGTTIGAALVIAIAVWSTTSLLEDARRRRSPGAPARVSLIEATRRRFRRLVVSTVVIGAALLPIVLGDATEDVASLGTVVLLGVVISGIVTLVVTPPLAATFEELAEHGREWAAKRHVRATAPKPFSAR